MVESSGVSGRPATASPHLLGTWQEPKINGCKRHLLVDTLGLLVAVTVSKANLSDQAGLKRLLAAISGQLPLLKLIRTDEAYRGRAFIAWVEQRYQRVVEIVSCPEGVKGFVVQPQRWVVERTLAWLGNYRRLSKDYEVLPETSETFIYLAMVDLMTKRLAGCSTLPSGLDDFQTPSRVRHSPRYITTATGGGFLRWTKAPL